jgi:hypothetical protein
MAADKPYVNHFVGIIDPNDYPVFITGNVKHDTPIFEDTGIPKVLFHIGR